jgi:hypothetical protein
MKIIKRMCFVCCCCIRFILARRRKFHMSEISASMPVHSRSLIEDVFFMPIFLSPVLRSMEERQYRRSIKFRDGCKQAVDIKRLLFKLLAPPSREVHASGGIWRRRMCLIHVYVLYYVDQLKSAYKF